MLESSHGESLHMREWIVNSSLVISETKSRPVTLSTYMRFVLSENMSGAVLAGSFVLLEA